MAVRAKKVAASELRQLSDEDLLKQVARSQYELVQMQWKQSRQEVGITAVRSSLRKYKAQAADLLTPIVCAGHHHQRYAVAQEARESTYPAR